MTSVNGMERLPKTFDVIQRGMARKLHLGAQLYVSMDGEPVIDAADGFADLDDPRADDWTGRRLHSDDLVLWLSATKPVGAVAIARLWEEGRIELDAPVVQYISEFGQAGKEAITLRHILTHTAGFRIVDLDDFTMPWDEIIGRICATSLEPGWRPGERLGYHERSSWYILAEVVQRVSGESYSRHIRDKIFRPLNMRHSWIGMPEAEYHEYGDRITPTFGTDGHPPARQGWHTKEAVTTCFPAGNGRGPMRELARFYEMLLQGGEGNGGQILEPETVNELTRVHVRGMKDETFQHRMNWGLGFIVDSNEYGLHTVPYGYGKHCSPQTFGHGGRQSVGAFADPAHKLVCAVMFNGQPGEPKHNKRIRDVASALYEDLGLDRAT